MTSSGNLQSSQSIIDSIINVDIQFEYGIPNINKIADHPTKEHYASNKTHGVRIPKRLASPLFPLPPMFISFLLSKEEPTYDRIQKDFINDIRVFRKCYQFLFKDLENGSLFFKIQDLSQLADLMVIPRAKSFHEISLMLAKDYTSRDIQLCAMTQKVPKLEYLHAKAPSSLIYILNRLKYMIPQKEKDSIDLITYLPRNTDDLEVTVFKNNAVYCTAQDSQTDFKMLMTNHFFFISLNHGKTNYVGDMDHLDYVLTACEILSNMELIRVTGDYKWAHSVFDMIKDLFHDTIEHNHKVLFMKTLETICLMKADIKDSALVSWSPVIETLKGFQEFDRTVYNKQIKLSSYLDRFRGIQNDDIKSGYVSNLLDIIQHLKGLELLEISSIHKSMFYSEIDETKGILKFLKRVHTPRPIDADATNRLVGKAKKDFTITFIERHNVAPNIEGPEAKKNQIIIAAQSKNMASLKLIPNAWWTDVIYKQSLDGNLNREFLHYAKDKGATRDVIYGTNGDSIPELLYVLENDLEDARPFDFSEFEGMVDPVVTVDTSRSSAINHPYPARLVYKEREQKEEGRTFGNATVVNKQKMSYCMELAKIVLGYFDGESMTISDAKRKVKLHEAAQYLADPNTFSILLDLEGHNQSMQIANTGALLEFVGNLFGYTNWSYLANYFNHCLVYFYYHFEDKVMYSQGQLGGIEGWMNPIWTLHTLLVTKLLVDDQGLDVKMEIVYSDDVNIVITLANPTQEGIRKLYATLVRHYLLHGMIVKASQTIISKNRVTILRQHYFQGLRADATIKRLFSATLFNEDAFISEGIEIDGISSSVASAMEMTNHILSNLYLKWYKCSYISLRSFASYFGVNRPESIISLPIFLPELHGLLNDRNNNIGNTLHVHSHHLGTLLKNALESIQADDPRLKEIKTYNDIIQQGLMASQNLLISLSIVDIIIHYLVMSPYLRDLFFYRLVMPEALGGLGAGLMITDSLSGHSNGLTKRLVYVQHLIKWSFSYPQAFFEYFTSALGKKIKKEDGLDRISLIMSEYKMPNNVQTRRGVINEAIKSFVKEKCLNKMIKELLSLDDKKRQFLINLMEISSKYHLYRIASFLLEHSKFVILDRLLKKVETSRSFIKRMKNLSRTRMRLYTLQRDQTVLLFAHPSDTYGLIDGNTDLIAYLSQQRRMLFPDVTFIEICEPLYDSLYVEDHKNPIFNLMIHSGKIIESGVEHYLLPDQGQSVAMKYDRDTTYFLFESIEKSLIYHLLIATKWICHNSLKAGCSQELYRSNHVKQMADLCLSTLINTDYDSLSDTVKLPTGGEVTHRLANFRYATSSHVRVLPALVTCYKSYVHQPAIIEAGLVDSNVNFDYAKHRLLLMSATRSLFNLNPKLIYSERLKASSSIGDVRINYLVPPHDIGNPLPLLVPSTLMNDFDYLKMRYLDITENATGVGTTANVILSEVILTNTYNRMIYDPSTLIRNHYIRLIKEFMFAGADISDLNVWGGFIQNFRYKVPEWISKTEGEILKSIQQVLADSRTYSLIRTVDIREKADLRAVKEELLNALNINAIYAETLYDQYLAAIQSRPTSRDNVTYNELNLIGLHKVVLENQEQIISACLYEIIIRFCIVLEPRDAKYVMNHNETYGRISAFLDLLENMSIVELSIKQLYSLYGITAIRNYWAKHKADIMMCLSRTVDDIEPADYLLVDQVTDKGNVKLDSSDIVIPVTASSVVYTSFAVTIDIFMNWSFLLKILASIREIVGLYANQDSFYSMTGADSFMAQVGLFMALLRDKVITADYKICDLTAGRGDGHFALQHLQIKHDSFAKKGIYENFHGSDAVCQSDDYDICNYRTLDRINSYDFIHMDVSFIKGKTDGLLDTLLNLISIRKGFSIRLSVIKLDCDITYVVKNLLNKGLSIYYATSLDVKPYQVYLVYPGVAIYDKQCKLRSILVEQIDPSTYPLDRHGMKYLLQNLSVMEMVKSFHSITTWDRLFMPSVHDTHNSVTNHLKQDLSLQDIMKQTTGTVELDAMYHTLTQLQAHLVHIENLCAPIQVLEQVLNVERNADYLIEVDECIYSKQDIVMPSDRPRRTYVDRKQAYDLYLDSTNRFVKFSAIDLAPTSCRKLLTYIPVPYAKKALRTYLSYLEQGGQREELTITNIVKLLKEHDSKRSLDVGYYPRSVRVALEHLAYAAICGDYKIGLLALWKQYNNIQDNRQQLQNQIVVYRKMGHLYGQLLKETKGSMDESRFCRRIEMDLSSVIEIHRAPQATDRFISNSLVNGPSSLENIPIDLVRFYESFLSVILGGKALPLINQSTLDNATKEMSNTRFSEDPNDDDEGNEINLSSLNFSQISTMIKVDLSSLENMTDTEFLYMLYDGPPQKKSRIDREHRQVKNIQNILDARDNDD